MLKQNKAITLITLIITIIVLLILAGVVINMTLGSDGIISKAQGAVDKYQNAQEKEKYELNEYEQIIDNVRGNITVSEDELSRLIKEKLEWRLAGNATGTTIINLPNKFNELYIEINENTIIIPYAILTDNFKIFAVGEEYIASYNWGTLSKLSISKTQAKLEFCYCFEGTKFYRDDTSTTQINIYYR